MKLSSYYAGVLFRYMDSIQIMSDYTGITSMGDVMVTRPRGAALRRSNIDYPDEVWLYHICKHTYHTGTAF
jgi:hypothetical protein